MHPGKKEKISRHKGWCYYSDEPHGSYVWWELSILHCSCIWHTFV